METLANSEKDRWSKNSKMPHLQREIGHVVEWVKTQFGYHLIKVEDKKEAEDAKLDDVKEQIKSEIMQKKQRGGLYREGGSTEEEIYGIVFARISFD